MVQKRCRNGFTSKFSGLIQFRRFFIVTSTDDRLRRPGARPMSNTSPYMYRKVKVRNFPSGGDFLETIFVMGFR
jgi:hypothetical protein